MSATVEFKSMGIVAYVDDRGHWTSNDKKITAMLQQSCDRAVPSFAADVSLWAARFAAQEFDGEIVKHVMPPRDRKEGEPPLIR